MSEKNTDEQIVTLNPVVGFSIEDLLDSAAEVVKQGILQPAVAFQHLGTLGVELTRVMLGKSSLEPNPKDRRFQAKGYQDSPIHSRTAKAWLAWQRSLARMGRRCGVRRARTIWKASAICGQSLC